VFERFRALLKRQTIAPQQPAGGGGIGLGAYLVIPERQFAWAAEVGDGSKSGVVMAPVNWIARTFAEAPLVVTEPDKKGQPQTVDGHELPRLIERPNSFYDGFTLWMASLVSWCTTGNSYWIKVRSKAGAVVELWWAPTWTMTPCWPQQGGVFISHYAYSPLGSPISIAPEDVVHLRHGIDPTNVRLGVAPIREALREAFTDDEAARFTSAILRNLGVPGLVVSPAEAGAGVSEPDALAVKAKFDERTTGDKRGATVVLTGKTNVTQFGFSPKDMDVSNLRNVSEERICAALGVPSAIVGYGSGLDSTKVGATMRELVGLAWTACLIPYQRIMGSQLGHQLLADFEADSRRFAIGWDRSNVAALQEDQSALSVRLGQQLTSGGIMRSEYRRRLGYDVAEDGSDDVFLMPLSVIEVRPGESFQEPPAAAAGAAPKQRARVIPIRKAARGTRAQRRLVNQLARRARRLEQPFVAELHGFFHELGAMAAAAAQRVLLNPKRRRKAPGKKDVAPVEPITIDELLLRSDVQAMITEMGVTAAFQRLQEIYGGHYLRVATDTVGVINDVMTLGVSLPDPVARQIVADGGRRVGLVDLTDQVRENLFDALHEGRSLGEGADKLVQRIRDEVPAGPWADAETRARVIARTETMHAQRSSALQAYRAADTVDTVMLFDDRLGYGDEDCSERNGQIVSFEEAEQAMEDEHPNGTLSFAPVVGRAAERVAEAEAEAAAEA
jgi:HK97 family phage portal protein